MSTTIDQRVVEMQFDNKHFEQNVKTSMSTLDKLKQSLNLTGAAKGFDNVSAAAKKVDMAGLSNGVETVRQRFSALEVMGVTALANITNSAVNAGKRMLSALTIDPIRTGFSEYELKMDSIKTIMASTGESVETVNKYLNELNEYSDQTIYSFADMTQNIGKFTNAGVKLEDAVLAIKGISNEAAVSGANANEASRAMYNFAQALSAGYVKLIDWKSIENANMATVEFKQQLIDTAVELGTVTEAAEGMYKTLDGNEFNATKNFNEVLQDQWMTTDVLVKTLGRYADSTTDIGKKAFAAAQDVTKFTQVWDILKETAQSGWSRTWELIIGDINQAKALLTPLTNFLSEIINKMSDFRNGLIGGALNTGKMWDGIKLKLENSGIGKMLEGVENISEVVNKAKRSLEDFQDIVTRVWRGDYGNHNVENELTDRYALLDKDGWDHRVVQDLVNKGYGYKITMEDVEASHKKFGLTMNATTESTEETTDAIKGTTEAISELTDEQLKNIGLTDEEIKLYRDLEAEAKRTGKTMDELAEAMSEKDGRTLLIESFKNAGLGLVAVFKAIGQAWLEIFPPMSVVQLYGIISSINEFSQKLKVSDETADKLKRTLKGVFAVVDILTTIFGGAFRIAFKVVSSILQFFNLDILEFTALIGDALVKIRDWFDSLFDVSGILEVLIPWVIECGKAITGWFASLKETELFKKISGYLTNMVASIKEWFSSFDAASAFKSFVGWLETGYSKLTKWIDELRTSDSILGKLVRIIDRVSSAIRGWVSSLNLGMIFTDFNGFIQNGIQSMKDWFNTLYESEGIAGDIIRGLVNGLRNGLSIVWDAAVELANNIVTAVCNFLGIHSPSTKFIEIGEYIIEGLINGIRYGVGKIMDVFSAIIDPVMTWLKELDFGPVFSIAIGVGSLWFLKQIGSMIAGVTSLLGSISSFIGEAAQLVDSVGDILQSLKKVGKALSAALYAEAFKSIAISLLILAGAIAILAYIAHQDPWALVGAVAAIAAIMTGLIFVIKVINKGTKESLGSVLKFAGLIAVLGGVILAIAFVATILKDISWGDLGKTGAALGGLIVVLGLLVAAAYFVSGNIKTLAALTKIGTVMLKVAGAIGILAIALKIMSGIPVADMKAALNGLAGIGIIVAALIGVIGLVSMIPGNSTAKFGATMLGIGGAFLALALTMKILSSMSKEEIDNVIDILLRLATIVSALIVIMGIANFLSNLCSAGSLTKFGSAMLGIGGAFLMLALTMHILAWMDDTAVDKAMGIMLKLTGLIAILLFVSRLFGPATSAKIGIALISLAGAIAILAVVAIVLGYIDPERMMNGVKALGILAVIMSGLIFVTKFGQDITSTLIAMVVGIAVLAAAIGLLTLCDMEKLKVTTAAMSIILGMFALVIASSKNVHASIGPLIVMSAAIAVIAGVLWAMSALKVENALANASALAVVMIALGVVLKIVSSVGDKANKAWSAILAFTALIVPLVLFAGSLKLIEMMNISPSIGDTITMLAAVMAAMAVLLVPLAAIGKLAGFNSLVGVLALTAMVAPLLAFAGAIRWIQDFGIDSSMISTILMLTQLMTAMTLLLVPLAVIGTFGGIGSFVGVLALTTMAVPLIAFAGSIALISKMNIKAGIPVMEQLVAILGILTDMLVKVSLIAPLALVGVVAITALVGVITAFGVIAGAIGGLIELCPDIGDFIQNGIPVLVALAEGLGEAIGAFVGGTVSKSLDVIGPSIVTFVENISSALETLNNANLDAGKADAIKSLAEALLILTGAELVEQLGKLFFGETTAESFSSRMVALADGLAAFCEAAKDIKVESVQPAIDALNVLANASIPDASWYEKLIPWAKTDEDLFGRGMTALANGMSEIAKVTNDEANPIDPDKVQAFVTALNTIANADIPDASWYEKVVPWARNDEGVFAKGITALAGGMSAIAKVTNDETNPIDPEKFTTFSTALQTLANVVIPDATWYEKIIPWANSDEGVFAKGITALAGGMTAVATSMNDTTSPIDPEKIKVFAAALRQISTIPIPDATWYEKLLPWANSDEGVFATGMAALASGVTAIAKVAGNDKNSINIEKIQAFSEALSALTSIDIPDATWYEKLVPWADSDESVFASGLKTLGEGIASFYEEIADKSLDTSKLTSIVSAMQSITSIVNNGGVSVETASSWKLALTGLGQGIKNLYTSMKDIPNSGLADSLKEVFTALSDAGSTVATQDLVSVANVLHQLKDAFEAFNVFNALGATSIVNSLNALSTLDASAIVTACSAVVEEMRTVALDMMDSFAAGIANNMHFAVAACTNMANNCITALKSADYTSAGKYVVTGFASGILFNSWIAQQAATSMANAAKRSAKLALKINSPSKVFRDIGYSVPEGFALGIRNMSGMVESSSEDMARTSVDSVKSSISKLASIVSSDIDTQPTIRPVLDLSEVRMGANAIDGMLNTGSALGVTANVNAISSMMNSRGQNGVNSDVVSAIDKLRRDLGNVGNTTYTIDGITYDDGTNISNAVKDLVRAARIERRV